ncbi:uncharacterized protein LOC120152776 [Hibiscus syriacus]|uniref:uncharacterized protein LOC120152776 n=1 Tax=Hibiscus syriacus TaxID=106335 RepID=UPI0019249A13|nr:uncharacterized protein LOC120152776 [Hibiscus syriacus]
MGLNKTYSAIRSQILLMKPLPTVNQAYSMIIQEELHRAHLSASPIEASVVFTTASKGSERKRFSGTCDYCKIKGHSHDLCYRLIGFPPDFKFNRKKVSQAAMAVNSVPAINGEAENGSMVSSAVSAAPSFTPEQYHQILGFLSKSSTLDSSANLAGTVGCNLSASSNSCVRWIIDTGATDHILSVFKSLQFPVLCPDLYNGMIKGIGKRFNGLYIFESKGATGLFSNSLASTGDVSCVHSVHDIFVSNKTSLCHAIFGHASSSAMKKLSSYVSDKFDFISFTSTHFSSVTKIIRSDNGTEIFNSLCSPFLSSLGILHQSSCVRTPQQNGVAERKHRHLLEQHVPVVPHVSPSSVELGQSSQQLETSMVPVAPVLVRESTRVPKQPQWLTDFIFNSVSTSNYPISDFISYCHLPCSTQSFVSSISKSVEPKSYHEAIQHPEWVQAMNDEILSLETNKTWSVFSLPSGKVPIGCKWVYLIKYNATGAIERYTARLVAKGYNQKEGVDYVDTFSPVVKLVIVRFLLAIASVFDWPLFQLDVYNVFLQGDLSEEVYMELPLGFCSQGRIWCVDCKNLFMA